MYQTHIWLIIPVHTEICGNADGIIISYTELQVNDLSIWVTAMAGHLFIMPAMTIISSL